MHSVRFSSAASGADQAVQVMPLHIRFDVLAVRIAQSHKDVSEKLAHFLLATLPESSFVSLNRVYTFCRR